MTFDDLINLVSAENRESRLQVCADSRLVKEGDVFVAIKGTVHDGHDFITEAIKNGARYIVCQKAETRYEIRNARYEIITVSDSAETLGLLAQAGFSEPAKKLVNLAVTGTNGKTTVAFLVRSVVRCAGGKCGLVGTIFHHTGSALYDAPMTTPDAIAVARLGAEMVSNGARYMMIEASSHALCQKRLAGVQFKAAAFTNLSGDHLDYHKDMQDYLAAKMRLFEQLPAHSIAVLNKQSPHAEQIAQATKARKIWYAVETGADVTAHIESADTTGTVFVLEYAGQRQTIKTPLLGRHNVSNHLAAAGLCLAAGFQFQTIAAGLADLKTIPGRLEPIDCGQNFLVLIDYAHTDDALKNVLSALKSLGKANLTVVFGCGGDRDRTKRPRMARVAEQLADIVIVTSDNPRTEEPEDIISEIVAGFEKGPPVRSTELRNTRYEIRNTKIIEPDRKTAICSAISAAQKNDIVLIAGKGHETYQIIGEQKFDFSDKAVAQECLQKIR